VSRDRERHVVELTRLDLVLLSTACIEALLSGRRSDAEAEMGAAIPSWWPDEHDQRFLRFRLDQVGRDPSAREWIVRGLVLRETGELIGHGGFHGPPGVNGLKRSDAVEIGYTVFPAFRGAGYATEAAAGLIRWAHEERGVRAFQASVAPGNDPSLAIVRKLGFRQTGEQWDEVDGLELVFLLEP
jgi:RimJ/RimL family protein N-acetyltransferase